MNDRRPPFDAKKLSLDAMFQFPHFKQLISHVARIESAVAKTRVPA